MNNTDLLRRAMHKHRSDDPMDGKEFMCGGKRRTRRTARRALKRALRRHLEAHR